jgi:hypothetical protein
LIGFRSRAPETDAKKDLIETCRGPAETKAAEMVEELLASDQARVVPVHVIFCNLAGELDDVDKGQRTYVRDAVVNLFRHEEKLHVTANNDRIRFGAKVGSVGGSTNKEAAILTPAAILEIELLFGVKILHGLWVQADEGKPVTTTDLLRSTAPLSIAEYMRERHVDKWGIIQGDSGAAQNPQGSAAAAARHPVGAWPHYNREFAEAWLKVGKGKS